VGGLPDPLAHLPRYARCSARPGTAERALRGSRRTSRILVSMGSHSRNAGDTAERNPHSRPAPCQHELHSGSCLGPSRTLSAPSASCRRPVSPASWRWVAVRVGGQILAFKVIRHGGPDSIGLRKNVSIPCWRALRGYPDCCSSHWVAPENRFAKPRTSRPYCFTAEFSGSQMVSGLSPAMRTSPAHNSVAQNPAVSPSGAPPLQHTSIWLVWQPSRPRNAQHGFPAGVYFFIPRAGEGCTCRRLCMLPREDSGTPQPSVRPSVDEVRRSGGVPRHRNPAGGADWQRAIADCIARCTP